MNALRLNLSVPGRATLDTTASLTGKQAVAQNMLVNFLTQQGSDAAFPQKGTDILQAGLHNLYVDVNQAQHYANFAAIDTLFFTASTDYVDQLSVAVSAVEFRPVIMSLQRIVFGIGFTFADGTATSERLVLK